MDCCQVLVCQELCWQILALLEQPVPQVPHQAFQPSAQILEPPGFLQPARRPQAFQPLALPRLPLAWLALSWQAFQRSEMPHGA